MKTRRTSPIVVSAACAVAAGLVLASCSTGSGPANGGDGDQVTITLSGPNQWNNQADSFGPAWEDLIARFEEEEPGITVETTVLPISSFRDTLSTQLAAGIAPDLIFSQTPHTPDQIVPLTEYMEAPNPYVEGNERWLDIFAEEYFGEGQRNSLGDFEYAPFNLVIAGLFYNADAFAEAGIGGPPETVGELLETCGELAAAGYTPLAMDSGPLGVGWTSEAIYSMMLDSYVDDWNVYASDGSEGQAAAVTWKSIARAILTGELNAETTPEIAESVRLVKEIFDQCATPNWSGIQAGATFVGADEFLAGDAAMAWGTSFATAGLADVDWEWSSFGFPTVSESDSELSTGAPARFGAAPGGTNYMIPTTTEGAEREAAVKFLQFVTSAHGGQEWLDATGAIPATDEASPAPGIEGLMSGDWATARLINLNISAMANAGQNQLEGYLLGTRSAEEQLGMLQTNWMTWAQERVEQSDWTEDWATE